MGDEIRCRGNRLGTFIATVIFAIGFNDLCHISLTLVRVVAGIRVGRITDGIAWHIHWLSNNNNRSVMIATRIFNDLELIAQNPLQDRKGGKFRRRRVTELLHRARRSRPASPRRRFETLGAVFAKAPLPSRST